MATLRVWPFPARLLPLSYSALISAPGQHANGGDWALASSLPARGRPRRGISQVVRMMTHMDRQLTQELRPAWCSSTLIRLPGTDSDRSTRQCPFPDEQDFSGACGRGFAGWRIRRQPRLLVAYLEGGTELHRPAGRRATMGRVRELESGVVFAGRYEVQRLLGEGDRKRTYLAHDRKLDRLAAVSLVKPEAVDLDPEGTAREARVLGHIGSHPEHCVAL